MQLTTSQSGFSLIEMLAVIVVIGILAAVAMQSMDTALQDVRRVRTEREMTMLAYAIAGDPELTQSGARSDFGYIGDVGAFPPNLQALYQNPGGYATWQGPYPASGLIEDNTGYLKDEWGADYTYSGGISLTSTGSGSSITRKVAAATSDYLLNRLRGTVHDAADNPPGPANTGSVNLVITIPDGAGSTLTKTYHPNEAGSFSLDSLPVGHHPLRIVFTPSADTLHRVVTILPRHRSSSDYRFASAHFTTSVPVCGGSGTMTLRPTGAGASTELSRSGCSANWECVSETTADESTTQVYRYGSFRTDLYELTDAAEADCNIAAVRVNCRGRKTTLFLDGTLRVVLRTHGAEYEGPDRTLGSSWTNYSQQWDLNPSTGAAWTWDEIADLQAGVSLDSDSPIFPAACTQVWVEVDYEP